MTSPVLVEVRIRDLGAIADATISLQPGMTAITGETGAGKTMLVTGLSWLCGSRADSALVRTGCTYASVEGIVELPVDHPSARRAVDAGAVWDGSDDARQDLVLSRTVTAAGRSRAHIGGRAAPIQVLSQVAEDLVSVHGQADQWRLTRPEQHLLMVDLHGGPAVSEALAAYRALHHDLQRMRADLDDLRAAASRRESREAQLRSGLDLLRDLAPEPGEDETLRQEDSRLSHAEELRTAAESARTLLNGHPDDSAGHPGAAADVARAGAALDAVGERDPEASALAGRLNEVRILLADVAADVGGYAESVDLDPARLSWVQQRRAALSELTRRYGPTVDDALAWGRAAAAELADLGGTDERINGLADQLASAQEDRAHAAAALGDLRRAAADDLARCVNVELSHLALGSARVDIEVTTRPEPGETGADAAQILFRPAGAGQARPITRVASGGELSRVMLALEVVLSRSGGEAGIFLFDEVDAGIGGSTALDVGARLATLARHAQVIVVTHLAQVAAFADCHIVVDRAGDDTVTSASVREVEGVERREVLATMMSGESSESALTHAEELLATARRRRC